MDEEDPRPGARVLQLGEPDALTDACSKILPLHGATAASGRHAAFVGLQLVAMGIYPTEARYGISIPTGIFSGQARIPSVTARGKLP